MARGPGGHHIHITIGGGFIFSGKGASEEGLFSRTTGYISWVCNAKAADIRRLKRNGGTHIYEKIEII